MFIDQYPADRIFLVKIFWFSQTYTDYTNVRIMNFNFQRTTLWWIQLGLLWVLLLKFNPFLTLKSYYMNTPTTMHILRGECDIEINFGMFPHMFEVINLFNKKNIVSIHLSLIFHFACWSSVIWLQGKCDQFQQKMPSFLLFLLKFPKPFKKLFLCLLLNKRSSIIKGIFKQKWSK